MIEKFEEYFGKKYDIEEALKKRGWIFYDENPEKNITYFKNNYFRICYDGNFIDENGFIEEISIFNNKHEMVYNGRTPKNDNELDLLIKKHC